MQRYIALIAFLVITGCSIKPHNLKYEENYYLFNASYLESIGRYEDAANYYLYLYKKEPSLLLLKKSVNNLILAKRYDKALELLDKSDYKNSWEIYYYKAKALIAKKDLNQAKQELFRALKLKKSYKIYALLGYIYLNQKDYEKALKFYKSAYAVNQSEDLVTMISYILYYYLNEQKEAIAYLETHIRIYGCAKKSCLALASMYSLKNDIPGLISVYKRLYDTFKDEKYASKLIELLIYEKNYNEAIKYAKMIDDKELLLELYRAKKDYKNALKLALELYKQRGDVKYLALSAIFEYELASKKSKKMVLDIAKKLEKVIKIKKEPIYLNYLGYLYIDNDINIKRGIKLVKEALQKEPNSPYYLDSLAWGYYKIKRCKEAFRLIKKVYYELGERDDEVKFHLKMIKKCVKERD